MADKETKSKSSPKETTGKVTKSDETKASAKPAAKSAAKTASAKSAAKADEKSAAKTAAAKPADVKSVKSDDKPAVKKQAATPESVVAKYSNRGRKTVTVEEETPLKKAKKSDDPKVAEVVEKHTNSRGKKTSVVADVKARKTEERYVAIQDAPSSDGTSRLTVKQQNIILWVLVGVLIASLLAGIILGAVMGALNTTVPYSYQYKSAQAVGYFGQQVGTVNRVRPVKEIRDGGLVASGMISAYPTYGYTLREVIGTDDAQVNARNALIAEANRLAATGTANAGGGGGYTWMDKDGYLYGGTVSNPVATQRQLYKHTASVGMYGGDVSDDEPGVIKQVTMRPRGYSGYGVTGIYAPAGEVIKIEISKEDMDATGGIVIHIGQALYNGQANNIWTAKNQMNRMPVILNTMAVNKNTATLDEEKGVYTAYVGSFLGGPLYIRNTTVTFTATISGGVNYSHFILGYTTPEEFEKNAKSSAPYFDLEVWSYGVLHSGPKSQANGLTYDDLYKAAILWEKVSLVTTTNSLQGIVFIYDPFVAAGAAVAFPGRRSVNCPAGWMRGSLNYNAIVTSGSWGNFHEYHHNFQGYGVGNGGEVTNNGMTLVSYALFTKISSSRSASNYGAAGLGGWNRYTSAPWALSQVMSGSPENGRQGLALYATLLHNFGADNYIQAKVQQQRGGYGQSYAGYLRAWQEVTHYDMSYYFNDLLGAGLGSQYSNPDYPMFVPVSTVYQTGRGIKVGNNIDYVETMQPYVIPYGSDFTIDLRKYDAPNGQYAQGSIVLPDGFEFTVKNITQPENGGKITDNGDGTYTYTPNKDKMFSGKIVVTLGVTKTDGAFEVDDIDLVLGFEQTHEINKTVLERTTYTYSADKMYTDAVEAYEKGYAGHDGNSVTIDHTNPVQNCNTDIWFYPDTEQNRNDHPDSPDWHFLKDNTVVELKGKLYAEEEGRYRIYLRGRSNCALYYSVDGGKTYQLGARVTNGSGANFYLNDENTYFDLDLQEKSWVYVKEVLIVNASARSFIGVGMKQWTKPMFTMQEKYYDKNGNEVAADSPDKASTVTKYYNYLGIEVSEEEANRAELMAPTSAAYVNAYRSDYEAIQNEFTTEYFYTRDYNYNYQDNLLNSGEEKVISTNYDAGKSWNIANYPVENLFDGNRNTYIHSKNGWGMQADRPLQFVVDLGEVKSVNRMVYYSRTDYSTVNHLKLEASIDGNEYTLVGEFTDIERVGAACTVDFEETQMRYYRLTFIEGGSSLAIISEIEMWRVFEVNGANMWSVADEKVQYFGNWTTEQVFSNFGYVMKGSRGSNVKFEFEGTRLGILSSDKFGTHFDVYVDGRKLNSVPQVKSLAEQKGDYGLSFLSDVLEEGKHEVVIKCTGEANFDSFVIYP